MNSMNRQKRGAITRCTAPTGAWPFGAKPTYVLILVVIVIAAAGSGTPLLLETFAAVVAAAAPFTRCVKPSAAADHGR